SPSLVGQQAVKYPCRVIGPGHLEGAVPVASIGVREGIIVCWDLKLDAVDQISALWDVGKVFGTEAGGEDRRVVIRDETVLDLGIARPEERVGFTRSRVAPLAADADIDAGRRGIAERDQHRIVPRAHRLAVDRCGVALYPAAVVDLVVD